MLKAEAIPPRSEPQRFIAWKVARMSTPLTTRIPIRDRNGNVVDEKEVATYAGLLSRAHEEGLKRIETVLVQVPTEDNGLVAIAAATVETEKGVFSGIGDANPRNVNAKIAPHVIRMAETRAKARALRDAVNIGVVSLEELGGESDIDVAPPAPPADVRPLRPRGPTPAPAASSRPGPFSRQNSPAASDNGRMTESQRRLLYRMLSEHGYEGDEATQALCEAAQVRNVADISRARASQLIDHWKSTDEASRAS